MLVDDRSNAETRAELERVVGLHPSIRVLENGTPGFGATVNKGIEASSADYVLLLNTDCLLSANAIPKMIGHCERESNIGLISPFSNNSPVLTVPMLTGYSYNGMNALLEERLGGEWMEACTVVGNALLVTRACLDRTGLVDTSYGLGYGEETDYQFRAMANGFIAAAALDTYVYHKGGESFRAAPKVMKRAQSGGRELFFRRWSEEFTSYSKRVDPGGAAARVNEALQGVECGDTDAMYVLPCINQRFGGCHVVVDICNTAARLGQSVQLASLQDRSRVVWSDPLFFEPICFSNEMEFVLDRHSSPKVIVATAWNTAIPAMLRAEATGSHWHYFVQGYEFYFEEGRLYRAVEETFCHATNVVTTSSWLKRMIGAHFTGPIEQLPPGFDERVFHPRLRQRTTLPTVALVFRGSFDKGQPFLLDLMHRMAHLRGRIVLKLIVNGDPLLPSAWGDDFEIYHLPLRKSELAGILRSVDVLVDASLHEGFGLLPLEALACGAAVIVSDSGGVSDFVRDGDNGFVIHDVNHPERYLEKLETLLEDQALLTSMQTCAPPSVTCFAAGHTIIKHCEYLTKASAVAPRRKRLLGGSLALLAKTAAFERATALSPSEFSGPQSTDVRMQIRLQTVERELSEIQNSKIWRTLCGGGAVLLSAGGMLRRLGQAVRFRSAAGR